MTPNDTDILIEHLNKAISANDVVVQITTPTTMQVMTDKGWRSRALALGTELILKSVRKSVKTQLLFQFEPVDARDFTLAELAETKVFDYFPELQPHIVPMLTEEVVGFATAKKHFLKEYHADAKAAAESEARDTYGKNDQWGIF